MDTNAGKTMATFGRATDRCASSVNAAKQMADRTHVHPLACDAVHALADLDESITATSEIFTNEPAVRFDPEAEASVRRGGETAPR
jgi:hypothetical protein